MDKKKKIKILEFSILAIIIIMIIIISILLYTFLNKSPKLSTSNETKNYSITRYYKAALPPSEASIYNVPFANTITIESSSYTSYLITTDNIINSIIEEISLNYIELPKSERNTLVNYCNAYDEIKSGLKMTCQINGDFLILSNEFHIFKLYTNEIETSHITFTLPLDYNEKITSYIEQRSKEGITYREVPTID